jgi:hypothetical protein
MPSDEPISLHLRLLNAVAEGHFEALGCPVCFQKSVSAWFTHPVPGIYRTWFVCSNCDLHTRAQHSERPKFFSLARIRPELEDIDSSVLNSTTFE